MSRTASSLRNLVTAFIGQTAGILISIVARIVFLRCLNEEYLGLNGLFTNILTVFSLVELGIGPAMNFSLYKPLFENDIEKIKSLMALYKKAYITIGCLIAMIGFCFTPFYTVFMDEVPDISHLTIIYWMFVANTAISYFFSYKRALIICDEKRYIATIYRYVFYFILNVLQIILLLLTREYLLFMGAQILFTFGENVAVTVKANKMYPYLKERNVARIDRNTLSEIQKHIRAMLIHKIGGMVVFSSDNLILSRFVNLVAVAYYSNYYLIVNAVQLVVSQVFSSLIASVGNLNASEEAEDRERLEIAFNRVFFITFWIYGFCACCLWILLNPFITIWLGKNLLFDEFTVLVIVLNFLFTGMRKAVLTFWEATATFYYDRYKPLFEVTINIIASIILARHLGAAGVFLGTIISTLATCIWVEPHVLFKYVFRKKATRYARQMLCYLSVIGLAGILLTILSSVCTSGMGIYAAFTVKLLLCMLVPNAVFFITFRKKKEFSYFCQLGQTIIKKISVMAKR